MVKLGKTVVQLSPQELNLHGFHPLAIFDGSLQQREAERFLQILFDITFPQIL